MKNIIRILEKGLKNALNNKKQNIITLDKMLLNAKLTYCYKNNITLKELNKQLKTGVKK